MTYVRFEEKPAAQRAADRVANEQWMKDHAPLVDDVSLPPVTYRPAVDVAYAAVASAH